MFNRRKPDEAKPDAIALPHQPVNPPEQEDFLADIPPPEFLRHDLNEPAYSPPTAPHDQPASHHPTTYQPTALKETMMARSPFAPPMPSSPPMRPGHIPAPPPASAYAQEQPVEAERRTLVVGRGISVQGTVQDAERLVVEGTMEATMINGLAELYIPHGGIFKGEVEVEDAEVAGTVDGTLTARNALIVRASGRVLGTARCRRLQVEDGGQITGRIEMITSPAAAPAAPAASDVFTLGGPAHE